jgi:hypothetical protein
MAPQHNQGSGIQFKPGGTITNSDLELAGMLLHETALKADIGSAMRAATFCRLSHGPPPEWQHGAHPLYPTICGEVLPCNNERLDRPPPGVYHVAGITNVLADVASRPLAGVASHFYLLEKLPSAMCPQTFLTKFTLLYPLPQKRPWRNVQPPSDLWSSMISTLRGQRLEL